MLDGTEYVECACYANEHTLRFDLNLDEKEIYVSTFLNIYDPWYKRAWTALKYAFGYNCKYGHFNCTIMEEKEAIKLKNMIDALIAQR